MGLQIVLHDSYRRQYQESIGKNNHLMVQARTLIKLLCKIKSIYIYTRVHSSAIKSLFHPPCRLINRWINKVTFVWRRNKIIKMLIICFEIITSVSLCLLAQKVFSFLHVLQSVFSSIIFYLSEPITPFHQCIVKL